jgi:hypothetical protein
MTDRTTGDPVAITGLIDHVLGRLARADIAPVVRLRIDWDDIAGPWSTRCRPVALRDGVLTVVVVSGLEATRLRYEAGALAARAAAALGGSQEVTRIAIRVATPAEQAASSTRDAGRPPVVGSDPARHATEGHSERFE